MVITQFSRIVNEYLMVYPLGVDVFLSQKAQKGAAKSRAVRGCFLCGNVSTNKFRTQNWGVFWTSKSG